MRYSGFFSLPSALAMAGAALCLALSGCSTGHVATTVLADALAKGGASWSRDDDHDLVRAATPFSLKLLEGLLEENPRHPGLLLAAASGFTRYAYAFVQQDADELEARDLKAAEALRERARRLYLRARDYGLRSLEVGHRGFSLAVVERPDVAVRAMDKSDVPALYWTASAWAAAIALSKDKPALVAQLPCVAAMMDRALALDEGFDGGAIRTFMIAFELARAGGAGDPVARARSSFERAVQLSDGRDASPYISMAENVSLLKQDAKEFQMLLGKALAIDPDAHPETRLSNLVMQRRARWLLARKDDLFLPDKE